MDFLFWFCLCFVCLCGRCWFLILLNNEAYLYHSNKSFRIFLEDVLKGTRWKSQYSGWNGCPGWDCFIRSRVTLIERVRHKFIPLITCYRSSQLLPKFLLWYCIHLKDIIWPQRALNLCSMTYSWCNEGGMVRWIHTGHFSSIKQRQRQRK